MGTVNAQYCIGSQHWPGVSKVLEEMGELSQVLGKLIGSEGKTDHWSGNLHDMMHDEIADVMAAIRFFAEENKLDEARIEGRYNEKIDQFRRWHRGAR